MSSKQLLSWGFAWGGAREQGVCFTNSRLGISHMNKEKITDSLLANGAIEYIKQWVHTHQGKYSLDDITQLLRKQPGAVDIVDQRPVMMIVTFSDGSGVGVSREGLDLLQSTTASPEKPWNPDDWGGMSEEEAFEEEAMKVLHERGIEIASQSWSGGSWSYVYKYNGKYYAIDEVEMCEYANPKEAFERAGIGRDTYDKIYHMSVASGYEDYIQK